MDRMQNIRNAAEYVLSRIDRKPTVGLILGSGLGDFADSLENRQVLLELLYGNSEKKGSIRNGCFLFIPYSLGPL